MKSPTVPPPQKLRAFFAKHEVPRDLRSEPWIASLLPSRLVVGGVLAVAGILLGATTLVFLEFEMPDARFLWARSFDLQVRVTRFRERPSPDAGQRPGILHFVVADAPEGYDGPPRGRCYVSRKALHRLRVGTDPVGKVLPAVALAADPAVARVVGGSVSENAGIGWIFVAVLGPFAVAGLIVGLWLGRRSAVRRRLLARGRLRAACLEEIQRGETRSLSGGANGVRTETRVRLRILDDDHADSCLAWIPTREIATLEATVATDRDEPVGTVVCDPDGRGNPWPLIWCFDEGVDDDAEPNDPDRIPIVPRARIPWDTPKRAQVVALLLWQLLASSAQKKYSISRDRSTPPGVLGEGSSGSRPEWGFPTAF